MDSWRFEEAVLRGVNTLGRSDDEYLGPSGSARYVRERGRPSKVKSPMVTR